MNKKDYKIYVLVFIGFMLFILPFAGISDFQVGRWWWVWNTLLLVFGALLMKMAIEIQMYRMAIIAGFIILVTMCLYFVIGPYFDSLQPSTDEDSLDNLNLTKTFVIRTIQS